MVKKKEKAMIGVVLRNYSVLGLVLVGMRYENVKFFSMRAIFAVFLLGFILHLLLTVKEYKLSKQVQITDKKTEVIENPYKPKSKKKKNAGHHHKYHH
jgi:hypothetical membrane protein